MLKALPNLTLDTGGKLVVTNNGEATFVFNNVYAGERIEVGGIFVQLADSKYRIATRKSDADPFNAASYVPLGLSGNDQWRVNAGQTVSITSTYPRSQANHGLWIAAALRVVSDYTRFHISNKVPIIGHSLNGAAGTPNQKWDIKKTKDPRAIYYK